MIKINLKYFLISFTIGILIVYLMVPKPKVIVKFPNPNNSDDLTYKDSNDLCYKFKVESVDCVGDVKDHPVVEEGFIRRVGV